MLNYTALFADTNAGHTHPIVWCLDEIFFVRASNWHVRRWFCVVCCLRFWQSCFVNNSTYLHVDCMCPVHCHCTRAWDYDCHLTPFSFSLVFRAVFYLFFSFLVRAHCGSRCQQIFNTIMKMKMKNQDIQQKFSNHFFFANNSQVYWIKNACFCNMPNLIFSIADVFYGRLLFSHRSLQ